MSFKIIIKISWRNILHSLVKCNILCIWIYRIYLYISRYSLASVVPPFKETCIFKCRNLKWLFLNTYLHICILHLILAYNIWEWANLSITKYLCTRRIHKCYICNLVCLLNIFCKIVSLNFKHIRIWLCTEQFKTCHRANYKYEHSQNSKCPTKSCHKWHLFFPKCFNNIWWHCIFELI